MNHRLSVKPKVYLRFPIKKNVYIYLLEGIKEQIKNVPVLPVNPKSKDMYYDNTWF